jgi:hypothetical protein
MAIRLSSIKRKGRIDETTSHLTKAASCQAIGYAIRPYELRFFASWVHGIVVAHLNTVN